MNSQDPSPSQETSERQKTHYEQIHDEYEDHYYDEISMKYRDRYYYQPMFEGLDLNNCRIADLACGSGHNSLIMKKLFHSIDVEGYDISERACADYERIVGAKCHQIDLTKPQDLEQKYDAAVIFGGLHHCVTDLAQTQKNIASLLRPGGLFLMLEPNSSYILEPLRKLWYRFDPLFDSETEHALNANGIAKSAADLFAVKDVKYMGGPGYFLLAQSMLFRLPKPMKRLIAAPLIWIDGFYNKIPLRAIFPYFVARWQKI